MIFKTKGIVIHSIKYGETSLVAYIYTEKFGRQAYLVKGAYSKNSSLRPSFFQPLNLLEIEVYNKPGRNLQKIKEIQLAPPFTNIQVDPIKNAVCLFVAEILYRTLREEENNPNMFAFIFHAIQLLDIENDNISDFHVIFLMQLTKYLGFFPTNNYDKKNSIFDLINGSFVSVAPLHGKYISGETALGFSILIDRNLDLRSKVTTNRIQRITLLETLSDYYYLHVEGMGRIKSIRVLREIFS